MTYSITPIPNRHRKKRTHYSGVFIVGIAFLAFILIGLMISLTIRACAHHKEISIADSHSETSNIINHNRDLEDEEIHYVPSNYTMPDSIIKICMPKSLDGIPEIVLMRTSYIVSYNHDKKLPNWVAWHLTAAHTDGPWPRCKYFYEDEEVPQPRATIDDYRGSGWTRGHMCPAGDNKWNEKAMYDTFSLINICPQNENLNNGLWNSIENDCRKWARKYGDIYIVCGPVFMNREHETIGANNVVVPEAFFKVVLCLTGTPKGFGFVVRNNDGTKKRDLYYNSIDQVERITGMDFFPTLPDKIEDIVESQCNIKDW